ncbi:MAG: CatB-related O-acetyltransferase [Solirubrobacterales bacterium]|nr:CatB-related O-acetyltransferase [Solirubrobacterales bacterium]
MRRVAQRLRRLSARAEAVDHARRSLAAREPSNAATLVALQTEAQGHIVDGTLVMGRESYAAPRVMKYKGDTGRVIIGNFASIAPDAEFYVGGLHRTEWVSQYGLRAMLDLPGAYEDGFPYGRGDINVGHDTWVTNRTTVLSGVTIGDGAVVGTGAVVTKDVPAYGIVAGNPGRLVGQRFSDEQIAGLGRIAWWDWPLETIKERIEDLTSPDIDAFIASYDPGA